MSRTEERLAEIQTKIEDWSQFVRTLKVPGDLAVAISTGRMELLKLATPRALSEEDCKVLYDLISGLIETNMLLQEHSSLVAQLAAEVRRGLSGLEGIAGKLESFGKFQEPR